MDAVTLTVVIPTIGRGSLGRAIASCEGADEIIVVHDTAGAYMTMPLDHGNIRYALVEGGDHGYTARTKGIELATGTHLAFMDDDDVYLPGAIDLFKQAARDVPVIFRMDHYKHGILWRRPVLEFGNVSTQMFVVPNTPEKLGVWAPHAPGLKEPGGDYTFLAGCVEKMGHPIWRQEIVAKLRPDRGPTITVVTPWLNHMELASDFAAAMRDLAATDRLIVVDNGSEPPIGMGGIRLDENLGFAGASNRGLDAAETDAVLFLNNDIAAIGPWLEPIRDALEPGCLVGAKIRYDRHGDVDGMKLPYLDGWCLAGMREDLLDLGGFDEAYAEPSYYSDNDLCLRARAAGMRLKEVPVALHHKESSTSKDDLALTGFATRANRERFHALARELMAVAA